MRARIKRLASPLVGLFCVVAGAAECRAVVVDDFTSDTLNPNWVQSTVLTVGGATGGYTADTTTNQDRLTLTRTGNTTPIQAVLLREDVQLDVGEVLTTDVVTPQAPDDVSGLVITMDTGITARSNLILVGLKNGLARTTYFTNAGGDTTQAANIPGVTVTSLFIERTASNTYAAGYVAGGTPTTLKTWTISGAGNQNPGAAVGYWMDIRGTNASAVFDNFAINPVPEPGGLAALALATFGLLRRRPGAAK